MYTKSKKICLNIHAKYLNLLSIQGKLEAHKEGRNWFRQEQGLSIRAVAKSCSVAPSCLANIESGDTYKTIGVFTLVKLSKFYGIPASAMLQEAGFIDSYESDLPELAQYLRAKYQLSPQAIRDMEMAKDVVDKKYPRK